MISSISFVILSVFYNLILSFTFFYKSHIKTPEIKCFKSLLITNLFGLLCEIGCYLSLKYLGTENIFSIVLNKIFLMYFVTFIIIITNYFISISFNNEIYNKLKKVIFIISRLIFVSSSLLIALLPIGFSVEHGVYSYGPAVDIVYVLMSMIVIFNILLFLFRFKYVNKRKFIPCIVFIVGCGVVGAIQSFYPYITLSTPMEMFVLFIMYFTIENPDMAMIEQLNTARDQAERANNAKSEFLSSMSHEIRTPLNAILGFSQALAEEDLPYQANEEVKDIVMASETLLEIVNGILDISKIEANKLEIVNTEYNLNTMLEELVSLTKARIGEKPLELKYSFSPDLPKFLYGDKVRVKQVVLNLLTNAVKYTKTGWIEFKVNCVKMDDICRLLISVQDTGIGIKQESIGKLFNKFERLDIEKNNTIEGTGLGLAITKKLLELMGGKIVVQSIYGEGSKFTVAIDQRIITTPTNPVLERTQELSLKDLNLLNRRILVVDDNMINLKVATRLLQDYHCIIDTLSSGSECVNKIAIGASYDLILMDDMMPKMSGTETLHKLQEIDGFNTPVVALTANAISGMREKYLSEGFNDYLSKPIDKTELNKILNKFLG